MSGDNLEQLRGEMHRRAGSDRGIVELARLASGEIDQLAYGVGREAAPRDEVLRRHECQCNRLEILHRIVGQLFLDARIDGEAGHAAEKDRRAVGLGVGGEAAPIICVAPGLLSTTKVWPVCFASTSAMARGRMSPMPPA